MGGRRGTGFLLLGLLAWIAGGIAAGIALSGLCALLTAAARGFFHLDFIPAPTIPFYLLVTTYGFQGTLLLAAWIQSRRVGLGFAPIRAPRLVSGLTLLLLGWDMLLIVLIQMFPALRDFARAATPDFLADFGRGGAAMTVLFCLLIVPVAPLAEELFFRGWFWEALRLRGHRIAVIMVLTTAPWLLLHGLGAPGRVLFLLPAAVLFSVIRHRGGGVRASLAAHCVNNLFALMLQILARVE